jgi:hypothetical protein
LYLPPQQKEIKKMKHIFEKLALVSAAFGLAFFLNPKPVMANHCGPLDPTCSHDGCNDWDVTCNSNVKPITKPIAREAWGEAGAIAYPAAASIMRGRHGRSVGLDDIQKKYLRPHYGGLVDKVVVVYNAKMMSEWSALGKNINLGGVDSAAQTYCNRIYVKDSHQSGNRDQLLLLAHELRHAQQCQELGGEGKFGYHYFREYKRAGQNYENNKLEQSAEERANSIASSVPNQLAETQPNAQTPTIEPEPKASGSLSAGLYRMPDGTFLSANDGKAFCTYVSGAHFEFLSGRYDLVQSIDTDRLPLVKSAMANHGPCPVRLPAGAYRLVDGKIITSNGSAFCRYTSYAHYERKDRRPIKQFNGEIPLFAMDNHFDCAQ